MAWTPDGSGIVYLTTKDSVQGTVLRQLQLNGSLTTELMTLPEATGPMVDRTGQICVGTDGRMQRVVSAPGVQPSLVPLPVPSDAQLSPDGRWLAAQNSAILWDVQAGQTATPSMVGFAGWSPESLAAVVGDYSNGAAILSLQSLASAVTLESYSISIPRPPIQLVWGANSPVEVAHTIRRSVSGRHLTVSGVLGSISST